MSNARKRLRWPETSAARWAVLAYSISCVVPVATALILPSFVLDVPFGDEWSWADLIYKLHIGGLTFRDLWLQHNEHRMFTTNVLVLGLAELGGWSQLREVLCGLLFVVLTQIGLLIMLRRAVIASRLPYVFMIASLLLYSLDQIENFDWGFQVGWFLCNACMIAALLFLGSRGQSWFALISGALIATIASFSLSQGLMIWFAGAITLLLAPRIRRLQVAVWVVWGAAVFALYFDGYQHPLQHPDMGIALQHPFSTVRYAGVYAGAVWAGWVGLRSAMVVGWIGIVAYVWLTISVWRGRRTEPALVSRSAPLLSVGLYALSVLAITTAGRVGFGAGQAAVSHYASIAIYLWISVIGLAAMLLRDSPFLRARHRVWAGAGLFAVLFVLYVGADKAGAGLGRARATEVRAAHASIVRGEGRSLVAIYPDATILRQWIEEMRAVKDGPFYP